MTRSAAAAAKALVRTEPNVDTRSMFRKWMVLVVASTAAFSACSSEDETTAASGGAGGAAGASGSSAGGAVTGGAQGGKLGSGGTLAAAGAGAVGGVEAGTAGSGGTTDETHGGEGNTNGGSAGSANGGSATDGGSNAGGSNAGGENAGGENAGGEAGAAAFAQKEPIAGLIDMQNIAWHNADGNSPSFTITNVSQFPSVFGGIVINAAWNALQPNEAGALNYQSIDGPLELVRAYNRANPSAQLGVKLRIYAGNSAPDWAKAIDGGPVTLYRNPAGCQNAPCPITVGKYWTPEFISAWRNFQSLVAARYDAEPLIRQVAVTSCAPQTDEPFVPSTDPDARANLMSAGYTDNAQKACLSGAVEDYAPWKRTLIDFTFNAFTKIAGGRDSAFSIQVMQACRAKLGSRCVLDNHALSSPLRSADTDIYDAIQSLGKPINFQTEAPKAMDCLWTATINQGVTLGASAIEVWPDKPYGGFDSLTTEQVTLLASGFTTPLVPPVTPDPCPAFN